MPQDSSLAGPAPVSEELLEPAGNPEVILSFTGYAWLTNFSCTVGLAGTDSDVSVSFEEVFEETDSLLGFMGALDISYERFVFPPSRGTLRVDWKYGGDFDPHLPPEDA